MPVGFDGPLGRPIAKAEPMRHDARPGAQFGAQLRQQPPVQLGKEKQSHHRGFAQIGAEQVVVAKLDEALRSGLAGVAARALDHASIELDADAARAVSPRSRDQNPAVAGAKVVDDVSRGNARKPKHRLDHRVRGREIKHVSLMQLCSVVLRCTTRRAACRVGILRSRGTDEEQCCKHRDDPVCHDSILDLSALEHRSVLTRINAACGPPTTLPIMNAADMMVKDVISVGPEAAVRAVATLMLERRISGVPVVDDERHVLGILSEGDLIRRPEIETDQARGGWLNFFLSADERARDFVKTHGLKAREVMTQPAIGIAPDTPLAEVVRLMERHRVKRLPVVENGKLAGLVTRTDLLRALVSRPAVSPAVSSDQELRERIDAMLRHEDWATSAFVNVQVEHGVAHLWGTVESASQREALILAVRGVAGVRDVQPHLGRTMPG